jgi:hypothetical protein
MGKGVIEDGVLGVEPFAVEDIAAPQGGEEVRLIARRPGLEEVEVPLARTAGEEVAAAL